MNDLTSRVGQLLNAGLNSGVQKRAYRKQETKSNRGIALGYSAQAGRVLIADAKGISSRQALPKTAIAGQQTFSVGNTNVSWRS